MKKNVVHYNKLIRDKVPEKMSKKGVKFEVRKLKAKEFETELLKKVAEEASGVVAAKSKAELISELADVIDVIDEIRRLKKISPAQVKAAQKENAQKKGGFKKRLFLLWGSVEDGYQSNEKKNSRRA